MTKTIIAYRNWKCPQCGFVLESCCLTWGESMACPNCGGSSVVTWTESYVHGSRDDWKKKMDPELDKKMGLKLREEAKNRPRRSKYVGGVG